MAKFQEGSSIWYGPEVEKRKDDWTFHLNVDEVSEIKRAADYIVSHSNQATGYLSLSSLSDIEEQVQFPKLRERITGFLERLEHGLGFLLWKGLPVLEWTHETVCAAFLFVGSLMGNLRQQNSNGHVLGHVKDLGLASTDPNVRVYQTKERQTFHTDSSDIVGLLCLQVAKSGGLSSLVSSGQVFNEILNQEEDLAVALMEPFPVDRRGEVGRGNKPFYNMPVYHQFQGYLSAIYQRQYINSSQRFEDAPRLSERQVRALDLFDRLCDDPRLHFTMRLEPGDMQFVNNHVLLHDRTAFQDYEDVQKRRHLLRIWIAPLKARPLPQVFVDRFGSVKVGERGGVNVEGVQSIAPLSVSVFK